MLEHLNNNYIYLELMRKISTLLAIFLTVIIQYTHSQRLNYDRYSPWFIGANVGATWQTTDVKNQTYYGWGLMLGRSFNKHIASPVSFDLRLRYLGGAWRGLDTKKSDLTSYTDLALSTAPTNYKDYLGFTYNNFQTKAHELNLELSIHLNRLTERTGWDPYIFGGLGLTGYRSRANLLGDNELMYSYDPTKSYTKSELKSLLNNDYESALDGSLNRWNARFMGHLGFGIGYFVTPSVALGFEHKTSFSGTDLFDGVKGNSGIFKKDIYHYSSLYLKIYLPRRKHVEHTETTPPPTTQNPTNPTLPSTPNCIKPSVAIIQPASTSSTSNNAMINYQAQIANLGNGRIQMSVNGVQTTSYSYNQSTGILGSSVMLKEGLNNIDLIASNDCGSVSQRVQITYTKCIAPTIYLTSPQNTTVNQPYYQVTGSLLNSDYSATYATINGVKAGNLQITSRGEFRGDYQLQQGINTIVIYTSNACGSDSKTIYVNYEPACEFPVVNFTLPRSGSLSTTDSKQFFSATISNIGNGTIQVYLNGAIINNYTFNRASGTVSGSITLQEGNNTLQIIATNNCGSHTQSVQFLYNRTCPSPLMTILNPTTIYGTSNTVSLEARILNITDANQVAVYVNGQLQSKGTYTASNQLFKKTLTLRTGKNAIYIQVTNGCGTVDQTINYEVGTPCIDPSATITNPSGSRATSTVSSYTVQGNITNVTNPQNIIFKVNGNRITNFNYNVQTGLFTSTIQLANGGNTIEISVNNECGYASASATVTYNPPCEKPVITWINPASNITVSNDNFNLSATVIGITNASDVVVKVNGVVQSAGSYNSSTKVYSKAIKLQQGNNDIQLVAVNNCGQTIASTNIYYKGAPVVTVNKPVVTITSPCNVDVMPGMVKFTGTVTGVTESSQIIIKINGVVHTDVTYTKTATGFNFTTEIRAGFSKTVTLEVSASNIAGSVSQTCSVKTTKPVVIEPELTICHVVNGVRQTLTIKYADWEAYKRAGATEGPCREIVDEDIQVCLKNVTLTIKQSQWADYEKMGAKMGACPEAVDNDIVICLNGQTMTIKESQWPAFKQRGASLGACPEVVDNDIVICVPVGRYKETRTIKESEWPAYQQQGATLDECPMNDPDLVICVTINGVQQTKTIKQSQWQDYRKMGATLGACPEVVDQDIIICMPGQNGTFNTITIKQSQWADYQKYGATLGACVSKEATQEQNSSSNALPNNTKGMLICVKNSRGEYETRTINPIEWPNYEKQGAVRGACQESSTGNKGETPKGTQIVRPVRKPQVIGGNEINVKDGTSEKTIETPEKTIETPKTTPIKRPIPQGGR